MNETSLFDIMFAAEDQQSIDMDINSINTDIGDLDNNVTTDYDVLNGYADLEEVY